MLLKPHPLLLWRQLRPRLMRSRLPVPMPNCRADMMLCWLKSKLGMLYVLDHFQCLMADASAP